MCGITGFVKFQGTVTTDEILRMNNKIIHRGPDDSGCYVNDNIGLGQVRLSILDLSEKGHQPMGVKVYSENKTKLIYKDDSLDDADYIIVFNGEIYNFIELRKELEQKGYNFESHCDTEVLLKGYIVWGKDVLSKINGMFAFVLWDKKKNTMFGARDRLGKKPLKYYIDDNMFVFSSELKAILEAPIKREIDLDAIDDYLTLQFVPAPLTGFKGIRKLEHGTYFTLDLTTKKFYKERYWQLDYSNKTKKSEKELILEIEKRLDECVRKRMIADVEVGAFLSGGVDSSAIVAFASKYKEKLKTFTIKFDEKKYDESKFAQAVAEQYKTDHHEFLVTPDDMLKLIEKIVYQYEEPYADVSQLPTYILACKTSQFVKVVLNGDGGDENFAGYDKYRSHKLAKLFKFCPFKNVIAEYFRKLSVKKKSLFLYKVFLFFKTANDPDNIRHMNYTHYFDIFSKEECYTDEVKKLLPTDPYRTFRNFSSNYSTTDNILFLDFNTYLPDDLMPKVDIATMAHGLESRSPILDYEFVDFVSKIPEKYKIKGKTRKILFKKMLCDKYLSKDILYRKKKGFDVPVDTWFRNELKDYVKNTLLDEKSLTLQIFKKEKVAELLEDQYKGKENGKKLWVLMTLNLWYNNFILPAKIEAK